MIEPMTARIEVALRLIELDPVEINIAHKYAAIRGHSHGLFKGHRDIVLEQQSCRCSSEQYPRQHRKDAPPHKPRFYAVGNLQPIDVTPEKENFRKSDTHNHQDGTHPVARYNGSDQV